MTLYLIVAKCPNCGDDVQLVEETDAPVGMMQDVPISASCCPNCGGLVNEWDVREESEIQRVTPTQERDTESLEDLNKGRWVDNSRESSSVPAPLPTTNGPDYAVLLNGEPTRPKDGGGWDDHGYVETSGTLDGDNVTVHIGYSDLGVSDVSVIVDEDLTVRLDPVTDQPDSGLRYAGSERGVEAVVEITPADEVAMTDGGVQSESGQSPGPRQWILDEVRERTEANPESDQGVSGDLWTSKDRLEKHAGKFSTPVQRGPVESELRVLIDQQEVLYWHGHITLATIPYLNAVVESERAAGVTRQILVDKCRRWLEAKVENGGAST